ncbi:MAG: beta-ketoacyl-ACP synthase III [Planctomycetota bacterium]
MMAQRKVGIAGVGKYLPEGRVTNADLEKLVDTSDEWIVQRTGIRERRKAGKNELTSEMAANAASAALADAGISGDEVDLVICCTVTPDQPFPATACSITELIGAKRAGGWDLVAACSGWVFGAQVAAQFIANGTYDCVVVIGVEKLTDVLDYSDRETCVLFGDGAGAAVFTTHECAGKAEYLGGSMGTEGQNEEVLCIPAGGTRIPASQESVEKHLHAIHMGGKKVYRFAVKTLVDLVEGAIADYGMDQLGLVVPHQVNQRIIESAADKLGLPVDRIVVNIDKYGNTSAASVPIALCEAHEENRLETGKLICMPAFGAGMSWGQILVRW